MKEGVNNPIKTAGHWAIDSGTGRDNFNHVLAWHLQHGLIWSGDDCFVMARPIPSKFVKDKAGKLISWKKVECDMWYVWYAAGKNMLIRFLEVAPYPLPYVAWHREKLGLEKLKTWTWEHYKKVCKKLK